MTGWLALALAAASLQGGAATAQQDPDRFEVEIYRSWQPPEFTIVDGIVEFDPRAVGGGVACRYVVGVRVADSAGVAILHDRWPGSLDCESAGRWTRGDIRIVETFQFAVVPGRYSVEVWVEPAGRPEEAQRETIRLMSLEPGTLASDLLLASEIAWIDSTDARPWTLRKGGLGIAASAQVEADPDESRLFYYLEVYPRPEEPLTGRVVGRIQRSDGSEVVSIPLEEILALEQSRPVAGAVSLAGLPPGGYDLELRLELPGKVVTRSQEFRMAHRRRPLAQRTAAPIDVFAEHPNDYFSRLTDQELADLFDPILVWLETTKRRALYESLTPDGKREFLRQYFGDVEPVADSTRAPASELDAYLRRIRHINRFYAEDAGRSWHEGWRTDRGRIYLLRGEPDRRVERPLPGGVSPPYEIWHYDMSGTGYTYLFLDVNFRHYRLVYSSDPNEPSLPGWEKRAGQAALYDLATNFGGIRPRFTTP